MENECPVCSNHSTVALITKAPLILRCGSCTHTFTGVSDQDPTAIYSEDYYVEDHRNWFANPNIALFESISARLPKGRRLRLLDVGCGNGDLLVYLQKRDPTLDLWGNDLAAEWDDYPGISFIQGDVLQDSIEGPFDAICGLAVIEHVDRPVLFVRKLGEMVRPGGLVFLTTVNNESLIYRASRLLRKVGLSGPYDRLYSTHHLQHFTNESLRTLLERNGFAVESQKNHNYDVNAVDVPRSNPIMYKLYRIAIRLLFPVSSVLRNGILQTVVCRRRDDRAA